MSIIIWRCVIVCVCVRMATRQSGDNEYDEYDEYDDDDEPVPKR